MRPRSKTPRPIVVVSDLHVGCGLAVMPREGAAHGSTNEHQPSQLQLKLCDWWDEFWAWVEKETGGGYNVVVNGDSIDGVHHRAVSQWTHNTDVQRAAAVQLLRPVRERAHRMFMTDGTEAHVGPSSSDEESIARELKTDRPSGRGPHSLAQLFYSCGDDSLIHFAHHMPTSLSPFTKSSGLQKEIIYGYTHSGRLRLQAPNLYVRSHRHECGVVGEPIRAKSGTTQMAFAWCTSPWQLMGPYMNKFPRGGAVSEIGGLLIKFGDEGAYCKPWVRWVDRPAPYIAKEV